MENTKIQRNGFVKGKRRWIKLYPLECLNGSIRYQLNSDGRGVWYDLLCFSSLSSVPGVISDNDGRPYPHKYIANRLNITVALLEDTLKRSIEEGRITEDEGGIHIINWRYYQSEYDRVKGYQAAYRERQHIGSKGLKPTE